MSKNMGERGRGGSEIKHRHCSILLLRYPLAKGNNLRLTSPRPAESGRPAPPAGGAWPTTRPARGRATRRRPRPQSRQRPGGRSPRRPRVAGSRMRRSPPPGARSPAAPPRLMPQRASRGERHGARPRQRGPAHPFPGGAVRTASGPAANLVAVHRTPSDRAANGHRPRALAARRDLATSRGGPPHKPGAAPGPAPNDVVGEPAGGARRANSTAGTVAVDPGATPAG